jgi:DNA-directed RNA polymerase beta' subunit
MEERFDPTRVVTNPNPLTKDKKFSPDGLFSELFFGKKGSSEGVTWQCDCGKYKGKFLKGFHCEECDSDVKQTQSSLKNFVWIDLRKYYIINPIFYYLLAKLAKGPAKLNKIISYDKKIDRDGNIVDEDEMYSNVGMVYFKENLFEGECIIKYLYQKSDYKDKLEILNLLYRHKDEIFISKIPVYDPSLRPATVSYKSDKPVFKFDEINNSYNFIIKLSNMINKENKDFELVTLPNLYTIQMKFNTVFLKVLENLSSKTGFIRGNLLGNRVNFSARNVITPLKSGGGITDVALPYLTFVELYSFQIVNILSKLKKISLIEAQKYVLDAQAVFNPEIYTICMELVNKTKYGCGMILNRNPTIARGSMLYLTIKRVKKDYSDLSMSIHNSLLRLIAGDYDGDVCNIFAIMDNELKRIFYHIFSPDVMFISNNDGKFNNKLSLDRDQILGIHQFNL